LRGRKHRKTDTYIFIAFSLGSISTHKTLTNHSSLATKQQLPINLDLMQKGESSNTVNIIIAF